MTNKIKKLLSLILLIFSLLFSPSPARADIFGGDVAVLLQILVQAYEQVYHLQSILQNGRDSLNLMRDLNSGVRAGLDLVRIVNPKFNVGVYGDLNNPENVLKLLRDIYGAVPNAPDNAVMENQDRSVAEVIAMNKSLYDYAEQVDVERERILVHSQVVSPQGAAKLQNQSLAILIGVMTQLLRTQSQMLKLMGQNMALENRKEKLSTNQFIDNYRGLSDAFKSIPKDTKLPSVDGGN